MKQVIQHLKSGLLEVADVPCPAASPGRLLVRSRATLISAGTERTLVEFGKASLLSKVRQNPERVKQVLEKIKSDGLLPTLEAVFAKLDEPLPLGYCNAGEVIAVGAGVDQFQVGDRVASNGPHAQVVNVPVNLCAKIPDNVDDDQAAFTVLSAIGLQGIRLLQPTLGERVAVFGLGLIGLVSVQMLVANGVRVLGIDVDPGRLELARKFGAETVDIKSGADPVAAGLAFSDGVGVDGVLITASAKEDQIVSQSARMSRKRGRIVLIGVVNLGLNRAEFYEKELSFQVSCSYGPGRYDAEYEERGRDYPLPFVRWTEQRNMQAVLGLLSDRKLDVSPLITTRLPLSEASKAYDLLSNDRKQLGLILQYPDVPSLERVVVRPPAPAIASSPTSKVGVGVIGAGLFTKGTLLPALKQSGATLVSIASASGVTASESARKYGFQKSTTDYRTMLSDPAINTIFITTRHNLHVPMVVAALEAGKHVFVEKPLSIDQAGLDQVRQVFERTSGLQLMVGFNRRYSPHAVKIRQLLSGRAQPVCMNMLVNAGTIPPEHWVHDPDVGGGRIIGEGCHWIDLMSSLVDQPITEVQALSIGDGRGVTTPDDKVSVALRFADGSLGNLHYFANGARVYPKEQLQIFSQGRVLALDNFRALTGFGFSNFKKLNLYRQDKGHMAEITGFVERIAKGGDPYLAPTAIWNVTAASLAAVEAAKKGTRVSVQ